MTRRRMWTGGCSAHVLVLGLVLAGCEGSISVPEVGPETTGMVAMEEPPGGGSSGADVEPEEGTTGASDPPGESAAASSDEGPDAGSESTDGTTDETDETGGAPMPCPDDVFEDNDVFGFSAAWNGADIGARSCADDLDWYQVVSPEVKEVLLQQPAVLSPTDLPFANLVLEAWCGPSRCALDDSKGETKTVTFEGCPCPDGERRFVLVSADDPPNPPTGTPYALTVP